MLQSKVILITITRISERTVSLGFYGLVGCAPWYVFLSRLRHIQLLNLVFQAGAVFARMVPPTQTEKEMRRRLAELRDLERESAP